MQITWKKDTKPELILTQIEGSRTYDAKEKTSSFLGFALTMNMPVMESLLVFPSDLDDIEPKNLIRDSLMSAPSLSKASFLEEINKVLKNALRRPTKTYHVLTSISAQPQAFPKQFSLLGSTIYRSDFAYPKRYASRISEIIKHSNINTEEPINYCKLIIKTKAKTPKGAMVRALRSIDAFRGLMCLQINTQFEIFGGKDWEPINKLRLGPIHTVHNSNGKMEQNIIWYEPNFTKADIASNKDKIQRLKNIEYFRRRLSATPLSGEIVESLLFYTRALDEKDASVAFLKMWNALENLTSPTANYSEVIRRSSFIFTARAYHEQVIDHLRLYRNRSVHAGDPSDFAKSHCFLLQTYFRALFWFFVARAAKAKTLEEVWSFLDQPADIGALRRRIKTAQEAVNFLKQPPGSSP